MASWIRLSFVVDAPPTRGDTHRLTNAGDVETHAKAHADALRAAFHDGVDTKAGLAHLEARFAVHESGFARRGIGPCAAGRHRVIMAAWRSSTPNRNSTCSPMCGCSRRMASRKGKPMRMLKPRGLGSLMGPPLSLCPRGYAPTFTVPCGRSHRSSGHDWNPTGAVVAIRYRRNTFPKDCESYIRPYRCSCRRCVWTGVRWSGYALTTKKSTLSFLFVDPPHRARARGSSASCSPSPRKLNATTVAKIASPGHTASMGAS